MDVTDDLVLRLGAAQGDGAAERQRSNGRSRHHRAGLHGEHRRCQQDRDHRQPEPRSVSRQCLRPRGRVVFRGRVRCSPWRCSTRTSRASCRSCGRAGTSPSNPAGLPNSVALAACGPTIDPTTCLGGWQFNLPRNSPGGELKGVEINYQQPFTFLPAPWNKLRRGAELHRRGIERRLLRDALRARETINEDLIQLSKNAFNATLYFENDTLRRAGLRGLSRALSHHRAGAQHRDPRRYFERSFRRRHQQDAERRLLVLVQRERQPRADGSKR